MRWCRSPPTSGPPPWLAAASGFAYADDGVQLFGRDGAPVAELIPAGEADRPSRDPDPPATVQNALPIALQLATRDQLIGRWVPVADAEDGGEAPTQPFGELQADGSWTGSNGCNGQGGRWAANDQGELIVTQGVQTAMGCSGMQPISTWLTRAVVAAFDGDSFSWRGSAALRALLD